MEDSRILELFFDRAEGAIEALDQKIGKLIYRIAINILGDPQEAKSASATPIWQFGMPYRRKNRIC